jgi:hypothetical protein
MNKAADLHEDYEKKLKELQETCPHEEMSDWMEEWWAPGHSTGYQVKTCNECNKILSKKTRCSNCDENCKPICGKEIIDDEIVYGDLLNTPPVSSMPYCADCCPPEQRKPR